MNIISHETVSKNGAFFLNAAEQYRSESEVRSTIDRAHPREVFDFFGFKGLPGNEMDGMDVVVLRDEDHLVHFVIGEDPNMHLADQELSEVVVGGATAGSAGTVSTASTFGCSTVISTMSSAASAGTIGSAS